MKFLAKTQSAESGKTQRKQSHSLDSERPAHSLLFASSVFQFFAPLREIVFLFVSRPNCRHMHHPLSAMNPYKNGSS